MVLVREEVVGLLLSGQGDKKTRRKVSSTRVLGVHYC